MNDICYNGGEESVLSSARMGLPCIEIRRCIEVSRAECVEVSRAECVEVSRAECVKLDKQYMRNRYGKRQKGFAALRGCRVIDMAGKKNTQDTFLNAARKERMPLTVFLTNGVQLRGVVKEYDAYVVVLDVMGKQNMIFKHAISTIIPMNNLSLIDVEDNEE